MKPCASDISCKKGVHRTFFMACWRKDSLLWFPLHRKWVMRSLLACVWWGVEGRRMCGDINYQKDELQRTTTRRESLNSVQKANTEIGTKFDVSGLLPYSCIVCTSVKWERSLPTTYRKAEVLFLYSWYYKFNFFHNLCCNSIGITFVSTIHMLFCDSG